MNPNTNPEPSQDPADVSYNVSHVPMRIQREQLQFKRSDILKIYVGKAGCRCGCGGHYTYPKDKDFNDVLTEKMHYFSGNWEVESGGHDSDTIWLEVETRRPDNKGLSRVICLYVSNPNFIYTQPE